MIRRPDRRQLLLAGLCLPAWRSLAIAAGGPGRPHIRLPVDAQTLPITGLDEQGRCVGMIETALDLVTAELGWTVDYVVMPWKRAQEYVREGKLDALCTRPTGERRSYTHFSATPLFTLDSSWAHFAADNPRAAEIRAITTREQLKSFRIGIGRGNSWPNEFFVGDGWQTTEVGELALLDNMVRARHIDLFFEIPELTVYQQRVTGQAPLASAHLSVLPDGLIPFTFGLRKSFAENERLIMEFEAAHQRLRAAGLIDKALAPYRV